MALVPNTGTLAPEDELLPQGEWVKVETCDYCHARPSIKTNALGRPTCRPCATGVPDTFRHTGPRVGRNAPCPCASGRKFKHCCLGGA